MALASLSGHGGEPPRGQCGNGAVPDSLGAGAGDSIKEGLDYARALIRSRHGAGAYGRTSPSQWMPHSVLSVPAQRPERGISAETTGRVQGAHPMER